MPKFEKNEFAIDFLWRLVSEKEGRHVNADLLFKTLFPGIKLAYIYKDDVLTNLCIPALCKQLPELCSVSSLEDAEKQYGKTIKIKEERKCDGYEWIHWIPVQD